MGSTGAGKTTLLRLIGGIVRPDSGRVLIDGRDVTDSPPESRGVGYFPQTYALFPHLSTWRNVAFPLFMRGVGEEEASRRALELLNLVGLGERAEAYPHELSGGMQQRAALARALASTGKLILLDEPLSALDAILRLNLRYELKRIAQKLNLTVLHVTHDQDEALSIADQVVVMRRGHIVQTGTPQEVYDSPDSIYVGNFLGEMNFLEGIAIDAAASKVTIEVDSIRMEAKGEISRKPEPIILAIRPENLQVSGNRPSKEWIEAKIVGSYFHGSCLRLDLLIGDQVKVIGRIPAEIGTREYLAGERIWIRILSEHAQVFTYPDEGLIASLAVE